jgi:hypothetical protein
LTRLMTSQQLDQSARFVHWGEYDVMYTLVAASGHRYAELALGVLSSEGSIAGAAATSFLQSTVEATGRGFTEEDRVRVYQHMARGYVDKLSLQIAEAGSVHREINYREAWDLHTEAFEGLGYGRDAWTLNAVFEVIGNDNDRQQYWDSVLNAAGNPVSELLLARSTYSMMFHARMFGNEAQAAHASRWLNRIETLDNAISVGNAAVNVSSKELNSFFDGVYSTISSTVQPAQWHPDPTSPAMSPPSAPLPPMPIPTPTPISASHGRKGRRRPRPGFGNVGHPGDGFGGGVRWSNTRPILTIDPLVMDLNGDGVGLTSLHANAVTFDMNNDSNSNDRTSWVGPADGLLVMDINENDQIDSIAELVSEHLGASGPLNIGAEQSAFGSGFSALASFDLNEDDVIDRRDAVWQRLQVWVDSNMDGLSWVDENANGLRDEGEVSELHALSDLDITQISLAKVDLGELDEGGNKLLSAGSFVMGGEAQEILEVGFQVLLAKDREVELSTKALAKLEAQVARLTDAMAVAGDVSPSGNYAPFGVTEPLELRLAVGS